MNRKTRAATCCAALGNAIFGFSFMFSRIALGVTQPFVMLMYRFVLTFALMLVIALWAAKRGKDRAADGSIELLRFRLRGLPIASLLLLGLVQPVGYFLCESYGISLTNSTFSGVIIALVPIVAIAFGALSLHEQPSARQVVFSLISIAGVVVMTLKQSEQGQIHPLGVVLLFGAVLTGVYFNVLSRKMAGRVSVLERTVVMMGMAAAVFTALAVFSCRKNPALLVEPLFHPEFLLAMGYLVLASSIVAFMALNYANTYLPVAKSTAFCNLTTLISLFAGVIFLREPFSALSLVASIMILIGIWGVQRA